MPKKRKGAGWTKQKGKKKTKKEVTAEPSDEPTTEVATKVSNINVISNIIIKPATNVGFDSNNIRERTRSDIVRGTFCQGADRFTEFSRDKQCMANALIAIAYHRVVKNAVEWGNRNLDEILKFGNQLYTVSRKQRIQYRDGIDDEYYLLLNECVKSFVLADYEVGIRFEEQNFMLGNYRQDFLTNENHDPVNVLFANVVQNYLISNNCGIFTCQLKSVALFSFNSSDADRLQSFAIFDSHSRDENGLHCENPNQGKSCLKFFSNIEQLLAHLDSLLNFNALKAKNQLQFELISVAIDSFNPLLLPDQQHIRFTLAAINENVAVQNESNAVIHSTNENLSNLNLPDNNQINNPGMNKPIGVIRDCDAFTLNGFHKPCRFCNALFYKQENASTLCCKNGAIALPLLNADKASALPPLFFSLYSRKHKKCKNFYDKTRSYNNFLAMASVRADITTNPGKTRGPPVIVVAGAMYHTACDVTAQNMKFGSIYFHDPTEVFENDSRVADTKKYKLDTDLLKDLHQELLQYNPFARIYRSMRELFEAETQRQVAEGDVVGLPKIHIRFHLFPSVNRKTHNFPVNPNEVGAVFRTNANDDLPAKKQLRVYLRGQSENYLQTDLPIDTSIADPLCYPLLFPRGDLGWDENLRYASNTRTTSRQKISIREFYCYRIMMRPKKIEFNHLFVAGRLFQQYIIDAYLRVEGERLNYIRYNQKKLRIESYAGVVDHVQQLRNRTKKDATADDNNNNVLNPIGKVIILPSTFTGGRRWMIGFYQDAMTIALKYGRPTYFITMTCNPDWPGIRNELFPGQTAQDRPDVVSRIFDIYKKELLKLLIENQMFGEVSAFAYTVEFQKRGLPHIHLIVFIAENHRPRSSEEVDQYISAEIPDKNREPELFERVSKFMMHGPCGELNKNAACTEERTMKCNKGFPKPFADETIFGFDNRIKCFRRRNDQRTVKCTYSGVTAELDNRYVVSYNPFLINRLDCHINVDIVGSLQTVKYLFKYITKGHDAALLTFEQDDAYDEVKEYIDTRYIGSCEAAWRLFAKKPGEKSHTIQRLDVHLPNEQSIIFRVDEEINLDAAKKRASTLMAFFELNRERAKDNQPPLYYLDVPYQYRFDDSKRKWVARKYRIKVLSRMYTISPRYREKFHLRLLLLKTAGPISFDDLRTVNGVLYETFAEAAVAAGLTQTDEEWRLTMQETVRTQMPSVCRKVFCFLIAHCEISDPRALWDEFSKYLLEDYLRRFAGNYEKAINRTISWIHWFLKKIGIESGVEILNLPPPPSNETIDEDECAVVDDGDIDPMMLPELIATLNQQQRQIFDAIVAALDTSLPNYENLAKCFYVQGPAGAGKTRLYNTLTAYLRRRNVDVLAVSFMGMAASLLHGGRTVHSVFKVPFNLDANSTSGIKVTSAEASKLARVKLLIWDEISMSNKYLIDLVDRFFRDLHQRPHIPFGGIGVLLGGDIRQLTPVANTRVESLALCFINIQSWSHFKRFQLKINMRADNGTFDNISSKYQSLPNYAEWLLKLGNGDLNFDFQNRYPGRFRLETVELPWQIFSTDVCADVFGEILEKSHQNNIEQYVDIFKCRIVLCPRNDQCDEINHRMMNVFPGEFSYFYSVDALDTEDEAVKAEYTTEHLNAIRDSAVPDHCLAIKLGIPVMLIKNLSISDGLINGTRMVVKNINQHTIDCQILNGKCAGTVIPIPRIDFKADLAKYPFALKRRQFPLRICFSITINKSQGQTFDKVGVNLESPIFSHGHLYVALSRVRKWSDLSVYVKEVCDLQGTCIDNLPVLYTQNVVFHTLRLLLQEFNNI